MNDELPLPCLCPSEGWKSLSVRGAMSPDWVRPFVYHCTRATAIPVWDVLCSHRRLSLRNTNHTEPWLESRLPAATRGAHILDRRSPAFPRSSAGITGHCRTRQTARCCLSPVLCTSIKASRRLGGGRWCKPGHLPSPRGSIPTPPLHLLHQRHLQGHGREAPGRPSLFGTWTWTWPPATRR